VRRSDRYITTSINLLAFASTRANARSSDPSVVNDVRSTYDIYFLHLPFRPMRANPGLKTVTTPEAPGNAPIKLQNHLAGQKPLTRRSRMTHL